MNLRNFKVIEERLRGVVRRRRKSDQEKSLHVAESSSSSSQCKKRFLTDLNRHRLMKETSHTETGNHSFFGIHQRWLCERDGAMDGRESREEAREFFLFTMKSRERKKKLVFCLVWSDCEF